MGKLLLLVAALFLAVAVLRVLASQRKPNRKRTAQPPSQAAPSDVQTLLPCPSCGVHMAASEMAAHRASHAH